MLSALLRRRGRVIAGLVVLVALPARRPRSSPSAAPPTSSSTTAARSTATRTRSPPSRRRPASRSSCAAAPRPSCSSACAARATTRPPTCSSPPTSRTSGAPRRPGCSSRSPRPRSSARSRGELRDPDGAWWALSLRIRTPMRSTERVPEDAITTYADLGDPPLPRPPVPAHVEQRVQPVARRRPDRQARAARRPSGCCAPGWPTTRRSSAPTSTCSRRSGPAAATSA